MAKIGNVVLLDKIFDLGKTPEIKKTIRIGLRIRDCVCGKKPDVHSVVAPFIKPYVCIGCDDCKMYVEMGCDLNQMRMGRFVIDNVIEAWNRIIIRKTYGGFYV